MKLEEIEIGFKFNHGIKGECVVIGKTKRTVTVKHKFGTTKVTYRTSDVNISPSDF